MGRRKKKCRGFDAEDVIDKSTPVEEDEIISLTAMTKMSYVLKINNYNISNKKIQDLLRYFLLNYEDKYFVFLASRLVRGLNALEKAEHIKHRSNFPYMLVELCLELDLFLFSKTDLRNKLIDMLDTLRETWSEQLALDVILAMTKTPVRSGFLKNIKQATIKLNFSLVKKTPKKLINLLPKTSTNMRDLVAILIFCQAIPNFPQFPDKQEVADASMTLTEYRTIEVSVQSKKRKNGEVEHPFPTINTEMMNKIENFRMSFDDKTFTLKEINEQFEAKPTVTKKQKKTKSEEEQGKGHFLQGVKLPTLPVYIAENADTYGPWEGKCENHNWIVFKNKEGHTTALFPTNSPVGGPYFLKDIGDDSVHENVESINLAYLLPWVLNAPKVEQVQVLSQNMYEAFTNQIIFLMEQNDTDEDIKKRVRNHMIKTTNKGNRHHVLLFTWLQLRELKEINPKDPLLSNMTFCDSLFFQAGCNSALNLLEFNAQNLAVHDEKCVRYDLHFDDSESALTRRSDEQRGLCTGGKIRRDFLKCCSSSMDSKSNAELYQMFNVIGENIDKLDGHLQTNGLSGCVGDHYPFDYNSLLDTLSKLRNFYKNTTLGKIYKQDEKSPDELGAKYRAFFDTMISASYKFGCKK